MSKCQQKQFKISGLKEDSSHIHDQLSNDEIEKKKKGQKSQEQNPRITNLTTNNTRPRKNEKVKRQKNRNQNLRIENLKTTSIHSPKMKNKINSFHSRFSIKAKLKFSSPQFPVLNFNLPLSSLP